MAIYFLETEHILHHIIGLSSAYRLLLQIEDAKQIKSELDRVTMKRLEVSLGAPNATIASVDAVRLLNYWNTSTTSRSLLGLKLKNPVDKKIQELETIEVAFVDKVIELDAAISHFKRTEKDLQSARAERVLALQAEKRAREALVRAKRRVAESKSRVNNSTKYLSRAETEVEKLASEREHLAFAQARQQDDVRSSMRQRASALDIQSCSEEDFVELQRKEQSLIKEYNALDIEASRLQSKANKLKGRAELLKSMQ